MLASTSLISQILSFTSELTCLYSDSLIPEHTQVYVPPYSLHRDARYFPNPNAFVPERWLDGADNPDQRLDAFIPFSYGPSNCVGRPLARKEMLMLVSLLTQRFQFAFSDGFDVDGWPETLHDHFVTTRGALMLTVSRR